MHIPTTSAKDESYTTRSRAGWLLLVFVVGYGGLGQPRRAAAESVGQEIFRCVDGDNEPAFIGWCHDGSIYAPIHVTPYQKMKRFYGLVQLGGVLQAKYALSLVQVGLGTFGGTSAALVQAGVVIGINETWALFQLGGLNRTAFRGLAQIGVINSRYFRGLLQVGGVNVTDRFFGLAQIGVLNAGRRHRTGVQIGLANWGKRVHGLGQWGVANFARHVTGVMQLGVLNMAKQVYGLQIGLVNITGQLYGLQLGLINVADNGLLPVMPLLNLAWGERNG